MRINGTVLSFGELLMRLSPPNHQLLEQANSFEVRYGGAEANVAVSLAYQGDRAAYVSIVPPNRIGDCALRSIASWGVDVSRVIRSGSRLGSYIFEVGASERPNGCIYDRAYSAISMASHTELDWDQILTGVGAFYVSGVTPAVSDEMALACREALEACRAKGITTICDLNYRARLWSTKKATTTMTSLLPYVDLCIANDEDAPACLGIAAGSGSLAHGIEERASFADMAHRIAKAYGCLMVASVIRSVRSVEESDWMSMVWEDGEPHFSSVHHVHVLEGVAAGDAYSAGLLHALLGGYDLDHASEYAIAASVLKLTVHGDLNLVSPDMIEAVAKRGSGARVDR